MTIFAISQLIYFFSLTMNSNTRSPISVYVQRIVQEEKNQEIHQIDQRNSEIASQFSMKFLKIRLISYKSIFNLTISIIYLQSKQMKDQEVASLTGKRNFRLNSIRESLKEIQLEKLSSKILDKVQHQNRGKVKAFQKDGKKSVSSQSETEASQSQDAQFAVSQAFFQKYQILEKLGQGCNATVYKCQDKFTQRIYAVKKAKLQEQQVQEAKETFFNIKALKHPKIALNIAFYYDSKKGVSFTVMEYCSFPYLSESKIQNEEELKSLIIQLVPVIQYLHQNNICHRDIKPQNILYDPITRQIKIIDFGISKKTVKMGEKREMLTIIGSNCYLAPQIYLGGGYDQRVDLWCLGVTIFKLVTGHTPFESEYHSQTIKKILKGDVKFTNKIWEKYTPESKDFVMNLLKEKTTRMTLRKCIQHPWLSIQKVQRP